MPTTTTKWGLAIPTMADPPAGGTQIAALGNSVDGALPQAGTLAARSGVTHHVGLHYYATDTKQLFMSDGTNWLEVPIEQSSVPLGGIIDYAGSTAPASVGGATFALADGAAISRTGFAALFSLIGTTYGNGDGSTTFNLPDLRGRTTVGPDNMGTAQGAANRLPNSLRALGQAAGEERHASTAAENGPHYHKVLTLNGISGGPSNIGIQYNAAGTGQAMQLLDNATTTEGSGTPHNNMQPYQVVNKLIRVK